MERLTIKYDGYYDHRLGKQWVDFEDDYDEVFNKLGALEDIETDLGITLEVLFKALKDGVYIKEITKYVRVDVILKFNEEKGWFLKDFGCYIYILKDYGKTWWLEEPKEKLKNDI